MNKNYYIKDNINKINGEKEKITVCKKYVFKTCTTHWPHVGVLCKGCNENTLTSIKGDYISADKLFQSIFIEILQNIKPSF